MTKEQKIQLQRSALMGLLFCLLREKKELTMLEVKEHIMHTLDILVDADLVVGDFIDATTFEAAKEVAEQELAVLAAGKIARGQA